MTTKVNDSNVATCNEDKTNKEHDKITKDKKRRIVSRLSHEKGKSTIKSGGRWCQPQR